MAFCIEVIKIAEKDENFVYYHYQFHLPGESYKNAAGKLRSKSKLVIGKLKIDKKTGDVHTLEFAQGDNGAYAKRAGWALIRYWKQGEFPDKAYWES